MGKKRVEDWQQVRCLFYLSRRENEEDVTEGLIFFERW